MNIREIAKRARVSTATVSRTINRHPSVQPQLAKRVWRIVEELGYFPNTQARALVSGRSRIFGLIVSEITNPFFREIVHVFEETDLQHNYEILVTSTVHDPERMKTSVRRMLEHRVEGVAVMTFGMEESLLDDLKLRNVPLVFLDVGPPRPRVSNIRIDYLHGIRQAVQHLAALRHERIAFITGPLTLKSALARKDAFCPVDERDRIGLRSGVNRRGQPYAGRWGRGLRKIAEWAVASERSVVFERHDGDWGDAQVLQREDRGSAGSFRDRLRQYPPVAIHSPAADDYRDVADRIGKPRVSGAAA